MLLGRFCAGAPVKWRKASRNMCICIYVLGPGVPRDPRLPPGYPLDFQWFSWILLHFLGFSLIFNDFSLILDRFLLIFHWLALVCFHFIWVSLIFHWIFNDFSMISIDFLLTYFDLFCFHWFSFLLKVHCQSIENQPPDHPQTHRGGAGGRQGSPGGGPEHIYPHRMRAWNCHRNILTVRAHNTAT